MLIAAGAAAVIGSVLDWVTITELPPTLPEGDRERATPFTGIEAGDGWVTLGAGVVLILAGILLMLRRASIFAWLGFLAAIVIGAVAIADYRGIDELFRREMDRVGEAEAGFGLILVAAGAVIGVIGSIAGVAATPQPRSS